MLVGVAALATALAAQLAAAEGARAATPSPTPATGSDLWISVTPQEASGSPNGTVRARVDFGNNGPRAATGVTVTYTAPFGTTLRTAPAGWLVAGNTTTTTLATLASAGRRSGTVVLYVPATAAAGVRFVGGVARISGGVTVRDPNDANNAAASRVLVVGPTPKPTPTPTPTPTPKPTPTPTPKPTPVRTTAPPAPATTRAVPASPTRSAATLAASPTGAPATSVGVTQSPTSEAPTAAPTSADPSPSQATLTVTDEPATPTVRLLPLLGSLACFTGAGIAGSFLYRRRWYTD